MTTSVLDGVVARMDNPRQRGDKWEARCPAHDDKNPSLGAWLGDNGAVIICCQAGCSKEEILNGLGLTWADMFPEKVGTDSRTAKVVDRYKYVDEAGVLLYEVVRTDPKGFRQRVPDGRGGWVWKLGDTRRVLYRLPEVTAAVQDGEPVLVVEGERDVHALEAAGYVATTCPGGAGKWRDEYTHVLRGADVIVIADKDAPGRKHARDIARALAGVASSIRCAEARTGKDAADHLKAGLSVENLELIEDAWAGPPSPGVDTTPLSASGPTDPDDPVHASLWPVDLRPVLDGSTVQPMPEMVHRDDGRALLYRGVINGIHGDSGTGKGWFICQAICENVRSGKRTMYLDMEDTAQSISARLRDLGLSDHQILTGVEYIRPEVQLGPIAVDHLCRLVHKLRVDLVVVDSLGEAFSLEGIDENKDSEVGPWYRRVARPLADTGAAVLIVDHSTKAADSPLHPSGSKRKRAAVGGASYLVEAVQPFVKGEGGRLRLTCAKDRHGNYRRGSVVAELVMDSDLTGIRLRMYAPTALADNEAGVDVELAARAAVRSAKEEGGAVSRAALEGLMKMKARATVKRGGIDLAVSRGWLTEDTGKRNARVYVFAADPEGEPND